MRHSLQAAVPLPSSCLMSSLSLHTETAQTLLVRVKTPPLLHSALSFLTYPSLSPSFRSFLHQCYVSPHHCHFPSGLTPHSPFTFLLSSHHPSIYSSIHHLPPLLMLSLCPCTFLHYPTRASIPPSFSPNLLFLPLAHYLSCRLRPPLITANTPLRVGRDCHAAESKVTSCRNRDVL